MRKVNLGLDEVKEKIKQLKGNEVEMNGIIKDVYPSVFTVKINAQGQIQTFSYFDVMCGNVVIL